MNRNMRIVRRLRRHKQEGKKVEENPDSFKYENPLEDPNMGDSGTIRWLLTSKEVRYTVLGVGAVYASHKLARRNLWYEETFDYYWKHGTRLAFFQAEYYGQRASQLAFGMHYEDDDAAIMDEMVDQARIQHQKKLEILTDLYTDPPPPPIIEDIGLMHRFFNWVVHTSQQGVLQLYAYLLPPDVRIADEVFDMAIENFEAVQRYYGPMLAVQKKYERISQRPPSVFTTRLQAPYHPYPLHTPPP